MFKIVKGRLKKADHKWQEYLLEKELLLCTGLSSTLNLLGIEEMEMEFFYKYLWDNNHFVKENFDSYKEMMEDIKLGNYGVGFDAEEIEIVNVVKEIELKMG